MYAKPSYLLCCLHFSWDSNCLNQLNFSCWQLNFLSFSFTSFYREKTFFFLPFFPSLLLIYCGKRGRNFFFQGEPILTPFAPFINFHFIIMRRCAIFHCHAFARRIVVVCCCFSINGFFIVAGAWNMKIVFVAKSARLVNSPIITHDEANSWSNHNYTTWNTTTHTQSLL